MHSAVNFSGFAYSFNNFEARLLSVEKTLVKCDRVYTENVLTGICVERTF